MDPTYCTHSSAANCPEIHLQGDTYVWPMLCDCDSVHTMNALMLTDLFQIVVFFKILVINGTRKCICRRGKIKFQISHSDLHNLRSAIYTD